MNELSSTTIYNWEKVLGKKAPVEADYIAKKLKVMVGMQFGFFFYFQTVWQYFHVLTWSQDIHCHKSLNLIVTMNYFDKENSALHFLENRNSDSRIINTC